MAERTAFRCGTIAVVGRPNVGKSTLVNALVGERVSITSRKAQTTRHRVRGIVTTKSAQFVYVDTPGFQTRHGGALNERLNRAVREALADVDVVLLVVDASRIVDEDRAMIALLPPRAKAIAALNKVDRVADKNAILPRIAELSALRQFAALVPVSAQEGEGLAALADAILPLLPEGPALYPEDDLTDRDERFLAAEFIREKIFRMLGEEVPYATTVLIDRFEREGKLARIHATVLVAKSSQRAIVLGEGGALMKAIATRARADMERLFGGKVYLEVYVRVKRGWSEDPATLARLGL